MLMRNQLAGCPGCGVIAQGHGRMVVEVIDAPWAGIPTSDPVAQVADGYKPRNHSAAIPNANSSTQAIRIRDAGRQDVSGPM